MSGARAIFAVSLIVMSAGLVLAEDPPAAPEPTAEHEALGLWVGSWNGAGEMKSGPFGPGGPMTWTEDCEWFAGGKLHVVCTSEGDSPMGPMKGLGIMGYDGAKKVYTHYGVDNSGWAGYSEGTRDGDTWTFASEERMGDMVYHSRFHITLESATRTTFTWEMSEDGGDWSVMMTGANTKK